MLKSNYLLFSILLLCIFSINVWLAIAYYPKYNKSKTEAIIAYDVYGYYTYLPALFIYNDIKTFDFVNDIQKKYQPSHAIDHLVKQQNGNSIIKYSAGMAIAYLPGFVAGHIYALNSQYYVADGFSQPYQLALGLWGILLSSIGLLLLYHILRRYFSNNISLATVLLIALATNYLEYSSISASMPHNYIFTYYVLLLFFTIRFYNSFKWKDAFFIGAVLGLMALTRPTEIIAAIIPLAWSFTSFKDWQLFKQAFLNNYSKIILAVVVCILIGSIQLIYWKIVADNWIVYSYGEQGFSWLNPHIIKGLFSTKNGWLAYSPIMVFSLVGIFPMLFTKNKLPGVVISTFILLYIYVTYSWDIWWYGGSVGSRAIINAYPILAFPLAAFVAYVFQSKYKVCKILFVGIAAITLYLNAWLIHHAHWGGFYQSTNTTDAFYFNVFGRWQPDANKMFLLQNDETTFRAIDILDKLQENVYLINEDTLFLNNSKLKKEIIENSFTTELSDAKAIRVSFKAQASYIEWNESIHAKMMFRLLNRGQVVKEMVIKLNDVIRRSKSKQFFTDIKLDGLTADSWQLEINNEKADVVLIVNDVNIFTFK